MLTVSIILISIAFLTSLFLNIKYINNLQNSVLIYAIMFVSFSGGAALLVSSHLFETTEVKQTVSKASQTKPAKLASNNPEYRSSTFQEDSTVNAVERNLSRNVSPQSNYSESALQNLNLFWGRSSTVNIPRGKALEIVDLSCDALVRFKGEKHRLKSGASQLFSSSTNAIDIFRIEAISGMVNGRQMPRGDQVNSRTPFSNSRPNNQVGRPNCNVQFRLL